MWFCQLASHRNLDLKTVQSKASSLLTYARWLEATKTSWLAFPEKKYDRCLDRYRGALILMRDEGELAPSTTSSKIRVPIQFYKWLIEQQIISPERQLWTTRTVGIEFINKSGFSRLQLVESTSLAIPNRTLKHELPEEGVWPVSVEDREKILDCAEAYCPYEIYLILLLGFHTGMRIQTITDLKLQTLLNAVHHPLQSEVSIITVGPGASPPVSTKYGITGAIEIPSKLLESIKDYLFSRERIRRVNKSLESNKNLVFLTKCGNPYARRGLNSSVAINVAMYNLRKIGKQREIPALSNFTFHQTRATFATELAIFALAIDPIGAVDMVRRALLQRQESSALHYIKFAKKAPLASQAANKFTRCFLGRFYEEQK